MKNYLTTLAGCALSGRHTDDVSDTGVAVLAVSVPSVQKVSAKMLSRMGNFGRISGWVSVADGSIKTAARGDSTGGCAGNAGDRHERECRQCSREAGEDGTTNVQVGDDVQVVLMRRVRRACW
jgi:hypothetical protein